MNKSSNMGRIGWRYSGRKPNEGLRQCARCHFALGIGIKISARLLGCSTKIPAKVRKEIGAVGIRLKPGRAAHRPISLKSKVMVDQFEAGWMGVIAGECRAIKRIDAIQSTYRGHAELERWRSAKSASKRYALNKADPQFRISRTCRFRIWKTLRGLRKPSGSSDLVGCTWQELVEYIQSKFEPWMTWDNYGSKWHVDHIKPCAAFDLSDEKQQQACFHYTNLRPLRAVDNWKKNSKFNGVLLRKRAKIHPLALK